MVTRYPTTTQLLCCRSRPVQRHAAAPECSRRGSARRRPVSRRASQGQAGEEGAGRDRVAPRSERFIAVRLLAAGPLLWRSGGPGVTLRLRRRSTSPPPWVRTPASTPPPRRPTPSTPASPSLKTDLHPANTAKRNGVDVDSLRALIASPHRKVRGPSRPPAAGALHEQLWTLTSSMTGPQFEDPIVLANVSFVAVRLATNVNCRVT